MTRVCPEGHASTSQDYCDTCGMPMVEAATPAAPASPAPPGPSGSRASEAGPGSAASVAAGSGSGAAHSGPSSASPSSTQTCSHCGAVSPAANLFCENCGFDFTTGALPERIPLADGTYLAEPAVAAPPPAVVPPPDPAPGAPPGPASGPAQAPPAAASSPSPRPAATPSPTAPPEGRIAPAYAPDGDDADLDVHVDRPVNRPPSQRASSDWVAEVWIDPTWFALQEGEGECPSPGPPDIVALRPSGAIIGRPSAARGVRPDIDCGTDTAVSRRHARLDTDGRRWWIEDLNSSNGTFVGGAAEPPPEKPIAGRRVEVDADDRIYLGAWTRLVVRPATESDRELA